MDNNRQEDYDESVIVELPVENNISESKKSVRKKNRSVKRKANGPKLSSFAYGIIIVLILMIVYAVSDLATGGFIYTVNGKFQSLFTRGTADEFSVEINANSVYGFERCGNGFMLLTENGVSFVDKNGTLSSSQQLVYSSPASDINGNKMVLYDRGNTSYTLMRNSSIYSQQQLDNRIIDFAVSSKNNYAVVLRDENSKTILVGCNSKDEVIYQWNCPKGYISDVVINDNGNKVAVTVINSVNAVLSSTVYILDFEYDSAYAEFEYTGETVVGSKFLSDRKLQIITDKNVYRISGKNQTVALEYGTQDICYSDFSEKYVAIITKDYSHDDTYTLSLFNKNGKLKFSVTVNGKVTGLSVSDKSIAVLFSDKLETYSNRGKLVGCVSNTKHYEGIVINKNFIYVLSSDSVKRFPAYGNMSFEPAEAEEVTE